MLQFVGIFYKNQIFFRQDRHDHDESYLDCAQKALDERLGDTIPPHLSGIESYEGNLPAMGKRKTRNSAAEVTSSNKKKRTVQQLEARLDPKVRGIIDDAIHADLAPTSRSTCVACDTFIGKDEARWGIRYAGNPLPGKIPVIPLYGTHPVPMYMWCHGGGCGLSYVRIDPNDPGRWPPAARVCHYCSDTPEENGLRLLCGGKPKGTKIRQHAFHIHCWKKALIRAKESSCSSLDEKGLQEVLIRPEKIGMLSTRKKSIGVQCAQGGIGWNDLTESEKAFVLDSWNNVK